MSKKLVYLTSFVLMLSLAGKGWSYASNPSPPDGAIHEDTWADLKWVPEPNSVSHDIYLGENYDDVKNGTGSTFQGNRTVSFFVVGFPGFPYPNGLVPGTTYYWRIDEVNDLHPDSPWTGDVWSFMIPPNTAYDPEPSDGAGFVDPNVTLSWQPGFEAKLHTVYFGDNFDDVNNASEGIPRGTTTYNPGPLDLDKTYYWRVDEFDGTTEHKGDVWSFTVGQRIPPDETPATGRVIYVDVDAVRQFDGSSWALGYRCLQDALAEVRPGDEIRVAEGVYKPDRRTSEGSGRAGVRVIPSGDRLDTFQLLSGVTIKGGYAGVGEADPDARDIDLYETVLSGDLDDNDVDVNSLDDLVSKAGRAENSCQVVTGNGTDETAVLDGFTITGGNADVFTNRNGGGMLNEYGSPLIINCTFRENSAQYYGGGIYNYYGSPTLVNCTFKLNFSGTEGGGIYNYQSSLNLTNCTFEENSAHRGGGIHSGHGNLNLADCTFIGNSAHTGAGIHSYAAMDGRAGYMNEDSRSTPMLVNCTFTANFAEDRGGGLHSSDSKPGLRNCTFSENSAGYGGGGTCFNNSDPNLTGCLFSENTAYYGGGMYNDSSSLTLSYCKFIANSGYDYGGGLYNIGNSNLSLNNCIVIGNRANSYGGGMYNSHSDLALTNCTLTGNSARDGSAIAFNSRNQQGQSIAGLVNCILWDNGSIIWINDRSQVAVFYSNIKGGWFGEGNIDEYPFFTDPNGPDNIFDTEDDDLRLAPLSPCIDSGDPGYVSGPNEVDLDGNPRVVSGRVDMGAYEFQGIIYVDNYGLDESGLRRTERGSEAYPFHTIQGAINVAKDSQMVLVRPGVYSKIDFMGKAITVAGIEGAPVIEGWLRIPTGRADPQKEDAVTFHTGEGPGSVLKNFIIRNSGIAISLNYGSSPTIRNLTIVDNEFGIAAYENSNPDISNCILWNNRDGDLFQCEARYSCFEGEASAEGNISGDPLFADLADGDYHLKSEGWRWNMQNESWTYDNVTSRCIDAGDPLSPLGDEPMSAPRDPNNEYGINQRINMGAYGGTCQASIPPHGWLEELSTE
jgi:parallel beta-helix repeat protein